VWSDMEKVIFVDKFIQARPAHPLTAHTLSYTPHAHTLPFSSRPFQHTLPPTSSGLRQYPKNFSKIASFLTNRSVQDCVRFYYDSKVRGRCGCGPVAFNCTELGAPIGTPSIAHTLTPLTQIVFHPSARVCAVCHIGHIVVVASGRHPVQGVAARGGQPQAPRARVVDLLHRRRAGPPEPFSTPLSRPLSVLV